MNPEPPVDRVLLGDCCQLLRSLPARSIDLILTDPPYLVRYQDQAGRKVPNDDNVRWMLPAFAQLRRVLKPDRFCISFYGWSKADRFLEVWRRCGFQPVGHFVFAKGYASPRGYTEMRHEQAYLLTNGQPPKPAHPLPDVLEWTYAGNRHHPTQKPVPVLQRLIEVYSDENDLVLDPFAGSGSTGVAARESGRRFLLIEQDPTYHQAASKRLGL